MLYFVPVKNKAEQVHNSVPRSHYDMTHYMGMIIEAADDEGKFYFNQANCMRCFDVKDLIEIAARIGFLEDFYKA